MHATSAAKRGIGRKSVPTEAAPLAALAEQAATTAVKMVTSHASAPTHLAAADVVLVVAVVLVTIAVMKDILRKTARIPNRAEGAAVVVATIVEKKATCLETVPIHRRKVFDLKKIGLRFNAATAVNVS